MRDTHGCLVLNCRACRHQHKARKPPKPVLGEAKFKEGMEGDSDDSEADERKRREILEEVLAEMHDPYFISPIIIPKLRGATVVDSSYRSPPPRPLPVCLQRANGRCVVSDVVCRQWGAMGRRNVVRAQARALSTSRRRVLTRRR